MLSAGSAARALLGAVTGWGRQLRPAKYRDATFHVEQFGGTTGRRGVDHEYPARDTPFAEDLGRSQRVWTFSGYVIGDNYPSRRDALIKACEQEGPGELVHPTIGTVQAVCRSCRYTEERERGRYCAFEFEFREAGALREPTDAAHPETAVENSAVSVGTTSSASFLQNFSTAGGGAWITQNAASDISGLAQTLQQLRLPVGTLPQSAIGQALNYMTNNAGALAANPTRLAGQMDQTFGFFTDAGDAVRVLSGMLQLSSGTAPRARTELGLTPWAATPEGRILHQPQEVPFTLRRARNSEAFNQFTYRLALREIAYCVPGLDLDNYDQAMATLREISAAFARIEEAAADAGDDEVFIALIGLRSAITRYIGTQAASLNPMVTYRVVGPTPPNSLTLAWRLYHDSGREDEIVNRTRARNPAFIPMTGRVLAPRPIWEWQA